MKIYKTAVALLLFLCVGVANATPKAPPVKPKFQRVSLSEFTSLTLNVMPHVGTQLIFPFQLDNQVLQPTLKINLTNEDAFLVPGLKSDGDLMKGQNTITIVGNPVTTANIGMLFVNIGGYNVTVALRTVFDVREISPNVIFEIAEAERNHLITHTVERHKEALKHEHEKALKEIDDKAREYALAYVGEVATTKPNTTNFKIEKSVSLGENRLVFYADKLIRYGHFSILSFEIDNPNNKDMTITDISLTAYAPSGETHFISGKTLCAAVVKRGEVEKCTFSTISKEIRNAKEIEVSISTDLGNEVIKW